VRKYFKEYFVLEYSKIKLAHTHILYQEFCMITFWSALTMSNNEKHYGHIYTGKRLEKEQQAIPSPTPLFCAQCFRKVQETNVKVITCFQIASPKASIQRKVAGDPFFLSGPFTKSPRYS